tara:strand:- start:11392 stop:13050 length:1659 start_codon:yes stop_codon:yes gene_type:complete
VYDSLNQEVIPFVSIYRESDKKGTLSDFEGQFLLEDLNKEDMLIFSYIGFERRAIHVGSWQKDTIFMLPKAQLTEEVFVLADNSFLYDMVRSVSKNEQTFNGVAKTYLELESFGPDQQLELYQGYYNGTYTGYDIEDLQMKNARFSVSPISKRIFASTEISKAIYLHKLIDKNAYFPGNPFELRNRKMRKAYDLKLNKRFKDDNGHTIYVITCEPRDPNGELFTTKAWIDSTESRLQKINLTIENAKQHPFLPLWPNHTIDDVGLSITKSFQLINGSSITKTVDFDYHLAYVNERGEQLPIRSRAVLSAYEYSDFFFLPLFNFTRVSSNDFRRIQMLPDNSKFWECNDDFQMRNTSDQRKAFLEDYRTINSQKLLNTKEILGDLFFEAPYVSWSKNRVLIDGISKDSSDYYTRQNVYRVFRYDFDIQFYVDRNELCDSVQLITKAIYDPYTSFYHFYAEKENQVFLNILFDLMEIERRKLHKELMQCGDDEDCIRAKYLNAKKTANELKEQYFLDVERGTEREELKKWNAVVFEELKIDNIKIFDLQPKEQK